MGYAALAVTIYHVWRSINHVLCDNVVYRPERVTECIKYDVCSRVKKEVEHQWLLPIRIGSIAFVS